MPRVGKRYFGYSKKSIAAARRYAKKKRLKLRMHKRKYKGRKYKM